MKSSLDLASHLSVNMHVCECCTTHNGYVHAFNPPTAFQSHVDAVAEAASAQPVEKRTSGAAVGEAHTSAPLGEEGVSAKAPAAEATSEEQVREWVLNKPSGCHGCSKDNELPEWDVFTSHSAITYRKHQCSRDQ